ncbi:MAG: prolyl oligopeptidase family serine peptidase [Salinivirgaceae bacterium]
MKKHLIFLLLCTFGFSSFSQKKVITTDDFANWNRIENRLISNNGKWVAYELNHQKGDGKLIINNLEKQTNDTLMYGYDAVFSPNSDFIAFKLKPAADSLRKAKLAEVKKEKMPKDSLVVYKLDTKEIIKFPKLASFVIPKEKTSWIAIQIEYEEPKTDTTITDSIKATGNKSKDKKRKPEKDRKDLSVLNPITHQQFNFQRIEEFQWSKNGKTLGMVTKVNDTAKVYALLRFDTQSTVTDTLLKDSITIKNMAIDELGLQMAFLTSRDTVKEKVFTAWITSFDKNGLQLIADTTTQNFPAGWAPSENGSLYFSQDGTKLFLGTAPKPIHEPKDSVLDEDKPKFDLWSYTDVEIQPVQLKNLDKEKKRTYLALYRIKEKKWIQLGDTSVPKVNLINKNNGEWALASTDKPYLREASWNDRWLSDYYLIDLKNGLRKQVLKGKNQVQLSPTGKFVLWYNLNDSSYYALDNNTGKNTPLTKKSSVPFCDELNDMPTDPDAYGVAGWSENDEFVLIYDRFDIWKIDPKGKLAPINATQGMGRNKQIVFRYLKLNPELVYIPTTEPIVLSGFNESNYQDGYYSIQLSENNNPKEWFAGEFKLVHLTKAKEANQVIWSLQTLSNYPNIHVSDLSFQNSLQLSDANPQQSQFNWATVELISWQSFAGDTLKGLLYKPENFDAKQKYPMVIYFYERNSDDIYQHYTPYPSHSVINRTEYASNGYLVFVPDIVYKTGYPGQSAYDAIVSGVNYLTSTCSFVDAKKMGLQGQSWGGYQTAYLITQTNLFACAMAGAPVSNMTSAYGGIRWESGMSRMFQYEHSQSRIGGSLWEKPMLYFENSPLFYAPKVTTPLLIMSNDNDGAVPWYQGIEFFMALRRLNKPAWLLNYNGMAHNIETKYWANRMDLNIRMMQVFDHYLKGKPAPEWMEKGIPAIDKGKRLGY